MGQIVENVYAKAILELAKEENRVEEVYEELKSLREVLLSNKDFETLISSPMLVSSEKKTVLKQVFETRLSKEVMNFLLLLVEKNRIGLLSKIIEEFESLYYSHANITKARVYTTMPLDEDMQEAIRLALKKLTSSEIVIESKVDEDLIGGIKVVMGDKIIDSTTLFRLKKLGAQLRDIRL